MNKGSKSGLLTTLRPISGFYIKKVLQIHDPRIKSQKEGTSCSTLVYQIDVQDEINMQAGKFLKKTLNMQDRIDVQG